MMNKVRLLGIVSLVSGILILNFSSGDLMGFLGGILAGSGLAFAITGVFSYKKAK